MSLTQPQTGTTVVVGLNGALQKRLVLPHEQQLVPGNVHRPVEVQVGVGGKGQDVAVTLSCLNFPCDLAQFLGTGPEGDIVHEALRQRSIGNSMTVRNASPLRTCTTIVASDSSTELVEPSGSITKEEIDELLNMFQDKRVQALCIMGSMPPGCPPELYGEIYKRCRDHGSQEMICVIDTVIGLGPLIQAMADNPCRAILKVNASELCRLAGTKKSRTEAGGVTVSELEEATRGFIKLHPTATQALCGLAVTDGKHPSHFVNFEESTEATLYKVGIVNLDNEKQVLFPIGAGDSVAAGTLAAWCFYEQSQFETLDAEIRKCLQSCLSNWSREAKGPLPAIVAAFAFGSACGSASCLQEQNSILTVADTLRLFGKIKPPSIVSKSRITL